MIKRTKTALILINYNGFEDTKECMESIANVNEELPFIVLVDNNSKDTESLKTLHNFYSSLHIIFNEKNVGFGRANNIGINWALENLESEYIFLLNNDTLIEQDCLENLISSKGFIDKPNTLVTPLILNTDNPPTVWYGGGQVDWKSGGAKMNFIRKARNDLNVNTPRNVTFASACAMFFKTSYLRELKGFDPYFFMYEEDVELSLRILKSKGHIYYEPSAVVFHKCQGSSTVKTGTRNQLGPLNPNLHFHLEHIIRGRMYNLRKHASTKELLAFIGFSIPYWCAKSLQYLKNGRIKATGLVFKYWFRAIFTGNSING